MVQLMSDSGKRYYAKLEVQGLNQPVITRLIAEGETVRVGRLAENEIAVDDSKVSRVHAIFTTLGGELVISDLSSLNGTSVNGRRISGVLSLKHGDVVKIGPAEITVRFSSPSAEDSQGEGLLTESVAMEVVHVTLMLVDVCSYTKMSEALPAQDVAKMLEQCFAVVTQESANFGGQVDKYIGDCVMVTWNGPKEEAKSRARQALLASKATLEGVDSLVGSGSWPHQLQFPWAVHVAVHSGEALQGAIGSKDSREFTVLGDTVNVAFRLNDLGSSMKKPLLVSENTAQLVGQDFEFNSLGEVDVEGRKSRLGVFTLAEIDMPGVNS